MKVLQLSSEKEWRGGEQQIAYLLHELPQYEVENFVGVRKKSSFESFCGKNGAQYVTLSFSMLSLLKAACRLKRFCDENNIDVVHAHSSKSHTLAIVSAAVGNKSKIVVSRRVDFPIKTTLFNKWKYNHPKLAAVLCVSNKVKSRVSEIVSEKQKCITVYSGIDVSRFETPKQNALEVRRQLGLPDNSFVIGNTSALEPEKDYLTFIKVIKSIHESGVPAVGVVVGKGKQLEVLKAFVASEGLADLITFTGFQTNIESILGAFDLFLMTSTQEGLGTSVLDAFASHVPVVSTNAGGLSEMVVDGQSGLLAPVGDFQALASKCVQVLTNNALRKDLLEGALVKLKDFTKEKMASDTFAVYKNITISQDRPS
ncbi:MAG TPA: glycosyltransferase [Chryseosolibacter sp.]|nr:glycosyltransferase [Chryseosolibacter sp.]